MDEIKVNKFMWDALSQTDKLKIAAHLVQYGVLQPGQSIVGDVHAPMPPIDSLSNGNHRGNPQINALGVDWVCRAVCDSSGTKSNCVLYGQSMRLCLESVTKSREIFELEVQV